MKLGETQRLAWLQVEFPPPNKTGRVIVEKFCGVPCLSDYDAEENVSEKAIYYCIIHMNIHVNDVNYVAFKETITSLVHYTDWVEVLHIRYQELFAEKTRLFDAHRDLLRQLSSICKSYDILPLAPSAPPTEPPSLYAEPLMYTGPIPPEKPLEKFAGELLNIIQDFMPNGNAT